MDAIAEGSVPDAQAFRSQIEACVVIDRVNTVVGFVTRTVIDRAAAAPLDFAHRSAHFEVRGTRYGMSVTLWAEEGFLSSIEGITYGEDDLGGQALADLDFDGFQLLE
ncbi:MAG TPA: hypothetical protein VIO94_15385 [Phenylobacterium sp.]